MILQNRKQEDYPNDGGPRRPKEIWKEEMKLLSVSESSIIKGAEVKILILPIEEI